MCLSRADDLLTEFAEVVENIYGAYLDATHGFKNMAELITKCQSQIQQSLGIAPSQADKLPMHYGDSPPEEPGSVVQHTASQGEVKARNAPDGHNPHLMANMCIVALYQYWEDHYRKEIQKSLGLRPKQKIRMPIFGDLKNLRNSIIHHRSVAKPEVAKNTVITSFAAGDAIEIDAAGFYTIIEEVRKAIEELGRALQVGGIDAFVSKDS